jgi:hypothetical protein
MHDGQQRLEQRLLRADLHVPGVGEGAICLAGVVDAHHVFGAVLDVGPEVVRVQLPQDRPHVLVHDVDRVVLAVLLARVVE